MAIRCYGAALLKLLIFMTCWRAFSARNVRAKPSIITPISTMDTLSRPIHG